MPLPLPIKLERFGGDSEALRARFQAERDFGTRPEVEIVVLTADSEEDLVRTHGRYFLDLAQLVERMN